MKIKKTIAAIAALTMALSSLPVMAFADDANAGSTGTSTTGTTDTGSGSGAEGGSGDAADGDDDEGDPAPVGTVAGGATGTVAGGTVVDGRTEYTVTIASGEGEAEAGSEEANARKNYHVTLPMELGDGWTFDTTSQYTLDDAEHPEWNIGSDGLKLWLPVQSKYCNIVLVKGDGADKQYKTILVGTTVSDTAPTNKPAGKHTAGSAWSKDATSHWHTCTVTGCSLTGEAAKLDKAAHSYTWTYADGTHTGTCVCGDTKTVADHSYGEDDVCTMCDATKPAQTPTQTEPTTPSTGTSDNSSSGGSSSAPAASTGTSAPAATTVTSAAEVRTSNKPNVTVNASETKVTTAMVTAFTKNKKAETLTLTYGSKVKVAIAKKDVKAAAAVAKMDFSTTGKNFIKAEDVKKNATLANATKVVQMEFKSTDKFDGVSKVTVQNRVGGQYAGQKAVVYENVNGKLVKVATTTVGGSGLVSFKIRHFGQYVIAVEK